MSMKTHLMQMIKIYQPDGYCWMNDEVSKRNPYTLHHIVERKNGGKTVNSNLAILTYNAHVYLNWLELVDYETYCKLNQMFYELNMTNKPPTIEYYLKIDEILENAPEYNPKPKKEKVLTRSRGKKNN